MKKAYKVKVEKDEVVIRFNIDFLVHLAKSHPDLAYDVINKKKWAKEVVKEIENFGGNGESPTELETLIDKILLEIYENASDNIKEIPEHEQWKH